MFYAGNIKMTVVEKQVVPFLLLSHKQKCFCKYGGDVRSDKSVQYTQYDTALQVVHPFW